MPSVSACCCALSSHAPWHLCSSIPSHGSLDQCRGLLPSFPASNHAPQRLFSFFNTTVILLKSELNHVLPLSNQQPNYNLQGPADLTSRFLCPQQLPACSLLLTRFQSPS